MDDLVRWLGEQLDEDERTARAADPGPWGVGSTTEANWGPAGGGEPGDVVFVDGETWPKTEKVRGSHVYAPKRMVADMHRGYIPSRHESNAVHIAAHDPARVLRQIDADRALLADYVSGQEIVDAAASPDMYDVGRAQGLEDAVRRRATAFDQRPGYREDWRP